MRFEELVNPADRGVRSSPETRRAGTAVPSVEYRIRRADTGEERWIARHVEFVRDRGGRPVKMFGVMRDITTAKNAELRQRLLTHELEHRIKNILATVSAIAAQTLRDTDVATARRVFDQRLQALAAAHDILNQTRWTAASLRAVVTAALAPFRAEQIDLEGPALPIGPRRALSLALAVNELGTNALKYGALSTTGEGFHPLEPRRGGCRAAAGVGLAGAGRTTGAAPGPAWLWPSSAGACARGGF